MSGEHTFGASDDIVRRIRENLPHIEWEQPLSAERERLAADEIERLRAERDAEIASLRKQIKVLSAWGTTKTCSSCVAWDVFPADEQPHSTETWGLCRAGLHDTVHGHFCADWEVRHER